MLNLCMVGTGGIAAEHMKAFQAVGGVHPDWVVSRTMEKALEFQRQWNFERASRDLGEALADSGVQLVVVASPSQQHTQQTLNALQAGKDVIVEIPVGLSLHDAESVAERSLQCGRRVLVCHTMRSFPAIRDVRRRVLAGEFHVSQIAGYFGVPRRRNQSKVGQRNWIDNLLWHHGCHMVDAALWVLGSTEVEQVSAIGGKAHSQFGMTMDVALHFHTPAGQVVTQTLTYNTEQFCWELRFIGDEETLTFRNGQLLNERNEQVIHEASWLDLAPQNLQMLSTLSQGAPSDYDISSVLGTMRVLQQAEASQAGEGRRDRNKA